MDVVAAIPAGSVLTYKKVAELAGSPGACRAVGNIMNRNRNPKVPCHRVIKSDGSIGGYAWGTNKKKALLKLEGAIQPQKSGQPQRSTFEVGATSKVEGTVLTSAFFRRPVLQVAPDLLGKYLVRRIGKGRTAKIIDLKITEVEAYDGPHDKACHAHKGRTARTAPMFGHGGRFYVYFCYGIHWMLNIVTGPKDYPAAILIRGAGDISGPAKLTKYLRIGKALNEKEANPDSGLWFEDRAPKDSQGHGKRRPGNRTLSTDKKHIKKGPRIGVGYAGPVWANKPYRFTLSP